MFQIQCVYPNGFTDILFETNDEIEAGKCLIRTLATDLAARKKNPNAVGPSIVLVSSKPWENN